MLKNTFYLSQCESRISMSMFETPEKIVKQVQKSKNQDDETENKPVVISVKTKGPKPKVPVFDMKTASQPKSVKQKTLMDLANTPIKTKYVQPRQFAAKGSSGSPFKCFLSKREIVHGWW